MASIRKEIRIDAPAGRRASDQMLRSDGTTRVLASEERQLKDWSKRVARQILTHENS